MAAAPAAAPVDECGSRSWWRSFAVSFVLLIGAGLMIRSFVRLQEVNPGFQTDRVLTLRVTSNFSRYTTQAQFQTLSETVLRHVRSTAGVVYAAVASNFPFSPSGIASGPGSVNFEIEGKPILTRGELARKWIPPSSARSTSPPCVNRS